MKAIHFVTAVLAFLASLFTTIAVSTNHWLINDTWTVGLFKLCRGVICKDSIQTSSVIVAVILIACIIKMLLASVSLFIAWNNSGKRVLQKIGTTLVIFATIQYFVGCGIFTWFSSINYPALPHWGLSYFLSWMSAGLSLLSASLSVYLLLVSPEGVPEMRRETKKCLHTETTEVQRIANFI